jgi:DNA replication protein DnaC
MTESLRSALKQLRLSGLLESLDVRLHEAAGHSLNDAEFLELLLQDELAVRSDRQVRRRVKAAQFRELKTIDDFDWSFNPSIKKKQVFDLATKILAYAAAHGLMREVNKLEVPRATAGPSRPWPPFTPGDPEAGIALGLVSVHW